MNSSKIGNISTAQVLAALVKSGKTVLIPFGDGYRYDLAIDVNGNFLRIQCKTGRLDETGVIKVSISSVVHGRTNGKKVLNKGYKGDIDLFGVYCPQNNKCYLIPIDIVGNRQLNLRLEQPKNAQKGKIIWANNYKI